MRCEERGEQPMDRKGKAFGPQQAQMLGNQIKIYYLS